ncbi:MAG TPA: glutaredoxin domain-containing protein [Myxococcota bacterium]
MTRLLPAPHLALAVAVAITAVSSCKKADAPVSSSSQQKAEAADDKLPPLPVVTDDASDLLFSFVDETGHVVAVSKVSDVPASVKSRVLVVDLKKTPEERQAHRYAFFVDLSNKGPDGTYPVSVVSRYDAAKGQVQAPAVPPPAGSVVVYSASWCGFCKKAKAWLKDNDVPFIDRDVEKTQGAQAELDEKLKKAGVQGGGIPVIDWSGTLVMGFDQRQLEKLKASSTPAPATPATGP